MTQPVTLMLVDDHSVVRSGLESLMADDDQLKVIGSYGTRRELLEALEIETPDVLLLDITLQDGNGLEIIHELLRRGVRTKILVVSMHDDRIFAQRCM